MKGLTDTSASSPHLCGLARTDVEEVRKASQKGNSQDFLAFLNGEPHKPDANLRNQKLQADAAVALQRIMAQLKSKVPELSGSFPQGHDIKTTERQYPGVTSGGDYDKVGFDAKAFMFEVMLACVDVYMGSAQSRLEQVKISHEVKAKLGMDNANKMIEEIKKQEDWNAKWGWLGPLFDFIVAIIEAVLAIVKAIQAAAEFMAGDFVNGAMDAAAAMAYFGAAVAGFVKFGAEVAEKCGADPKTCKKIEDIAGYVQLGCELGGMAVDLFKMGALFKGIKELGQHLKEGLKPLLKEIGEAVKAGNMKEVERLLEMVAREVSQDFAKFGHEELEAWASEMLKELENSPLGGPLKKLIKAIGEGVVKDILVKILEKEVGGALKTLLKEISEEVEKEITEKVGKEFTKSMMWKALKETMFDATHIVFMVGKSGQEVAGAVTGVTKADSNYEIGKLQTKMSWLTMMMMMLERMTEESKEHQKNDMEKVSSSIKEASDMSAKMTMVSVNVATSIV